MDEKLNESEKAELAKLFQHIDTDNSGKIDYTGKLLTYILRIYCCYNESKPVFEN